MNTALPQTCIIMLINSNVQQVQKNKTQVKTRKKNRELNNYYEQNCAVNKTNYSRTPQLVPDNSAKNLMRKI